MFDVLVELTGSDPSVSATHIGKLRRELLKAEPPYTPEELRRLPSVLPWVVQNPRKLTLGEIQKHVGMSRVVEVKPLKTGNYDIEHSTPSGMCRFVSCPDCQNKRGNIGDPIADNPKFKKTGPLMWKPDTHEDDDSYYS